MSKNKKGNIVSLNAGKLSPEKYIRAQARSLPVTECLITKGWQDAGIANIIIARMHKTGALTVGLYLIDLYCLGLKDTNYKFNISPAEFEYFKQEDIGFEKCGYVTAHNIIYGGIAFAEDYGFKPHKDFAISRFILEEDDDEVELIDIDFGLDGRPCYFPGPHDTDVRINNIEATLERNAGPGNYSIIYPGDEFDDEDDEFAFDENATMETMKAINQGFIDILKNVNKIYDEYVRMPEVKKMVKEPFIGVNYEISEDPIGNELIRFDNAAQEGQYNTLYQMVFADNELGPVIKELEEVVKNYPDKPVFHNLLQSAYIIDGQNVKADDMIFNTYQRFPDYLFAKVAYANMLMDMGQFDPVLSVFNGKPDLGYLYPERKIFHVTEASAYYSTLCRYFIGMDNIDSADLYMNAILENNLTDMPGQTIVHAVTRQLAGIKLKKIEEAGKSGLII